MTDPLPMFEAKRAEAQQARRDALANLQDALARFEAASEEERRAVDQEAIASAQSMYSVMNLPRPTHMGRSVSDPEIVTVHFGPGQFVTLKDVTANVIWELVEQAERRLAALNFIAKERGYVRGT